MAVLVVDFKRNVKSSDLEKALRESAKYLGLGISIFDDTIECCEPVPNSTPIMSVLKRQYFETIVKLSKYGLPMFAGDFKRSDSGEVQLDRMYVYCGLEYGLASKQTVKSYVANVFNNLKFNQ